MLAVLTGLPGCGKTTTCQRLVEHLRAGGACCSGILTHRTAPESDAEREMEDIATGTRRVLTCDPSARGVIRAGPTAYRPDVLQWANDCLRRGAADGGVLVVDELGALEVEHGHGLTAALELAPRVERGVFVVRSGLVESFLERARLPKAVVIALGYRTAEADLEDLIRVLDWF